MTDTLSTGATDQPHQPDRSHQSDDLAEIRDLVSRLGRWLDARDFDRSRAVFADDVAADTPGGSARGLDQVVAQASRNHTADERTQHLITDVLVDLAGDRADVRANLLVAFATDADPFNARLAGSRYRFETVRTPAGWRVRRVEVEPVWRSGPWDR